MLNDPMILNDPISLIIAADLNSHADPLPVDAVWQVSLDPQKALQIETNLSLAVRSLKIFPVFQVENRPISQISSFFSNPIIESWLPDYFAFVFRPQIGLLVRYEVWAKTPQDLLGRVTLTNENTELTEFGVQMVGELLPTDGKSGFAPTKFKYQNLLRASAGNLELALWLDQPSKPVLSPLPALSWSKAFVPGERASMLWCCSMLGSTQRPFNKLSLDLPDNWEALIAHRQSSLQADFLEVETGNTAFDLTIRSSQFLASQLVRDEGGFAKTRNPSLNATSQPVSLPHPAEIWQLVLATLSTHPAFADQLLRQSVSGTQTAQKSKPEPPFPVFARLAWKVFQHTQDRQFLSDLFDSLLQATFNWFKSDTNEKLVGLPHWSSLEQARFISTFGFSLLEAEQLPCDISSTENIALGVLLRSELTALKKIATVLEKLETIPPIDDRLSRLDAALESWLIETPELSWRDALTHTAGTSQVLFNGPHQSARKLNFSLSSPARLHLQIRPKPQTKRPTEITIVGRDPHDQPITNHIQPSQIVWLPGYFYARSTQAFKTVESISLEGYEFAELTLYTACLPIDDITKLLMDFIVVEGQTNTKRIEVWLDRTVETAFGFPERLDIIDDPSSQQVNLFWHSLLLEELIESGQKKTAWTLLESLLNAHAQILSTEHALFSSFCAANAKPSGTRNCVDGLLPLDQLLEIAGVKIFNSKKVSLGGENGFSQPITFRYRGLEVTRDGKNGLIRMPNGTEFHHFGSTTKTFQID